MKNINDIIAKRVAQEFRSGDLVNLGFGIPTGAVNYIPEGVDVIFQSENGFVNLEKAPEDLADWDKDITNAGTAPATIGKGGAFFDIATSFGMIRGGHVDMTILGALQVDSDGSVANWIIPGKFTPGIGGAMDLLTGAKKTIIAMEHTCKGEPKVLNKCTLPITASCVVDVLVTEFAVFTIKDKVMTLKEIATDITLEELKKITPANYIVDPNLKSYSI